jgi:hypothetical protein
MSELQLTHRGRDAATTADITDFGAWLRRTPIASRERDSQI